jgi:uncharacterized membrane protein
MTENNLPEQSGIPSYTVDSVERIREGFYLFAKSPGVMIAYLVIGWTIIYTVTYIPFLGAVLSFVAGAFHSAGFYILFDKLYEKGTVKIEDCLGAFDIIGQATLGTLIGGILTTIGFLFLLIPGLYLTVAYELFMPYLLFDRIGGWEALERSRKVVTLNFWGVSWFASLCLLVNFLGVLALGLGLLVTVPTTVGATYMLYRHIKRQIL